ELGAELGIEVIDQRVQIRDPWLGHAPLAAGQLHRQHGDVRSEPLPPARVRRRPAAREREAEQAKRRRGGGPRARREVSGHGALQSLGAWYVGTWYVAATRDGPGDASGAGRVSSTAVSAASSTSVGRPRITRTGGAVIPVGCRACGRAGWHAWRAA